MSKLIFLKLLRSLYSVPYNLKSGEMYAASKTLSLNQLLEDPNARPFGMNYEL